MGFKEEIKVHLSTRSATVSGGFSKARWVIKDPIRPPNALYRTKIQLSNAIIPNSFDETSEERDNVKITFQYRRAVAPYGEWATVPVTITTIENPTPTLTYNLLYNAMIQAFQMDATLAETVYKPIIRFDGSSSLFRFEVVNWITDDILLPSPSQDGIMPLNFRILASDGSSPLLSVLGFDESEDINMTVVSYSFASSVITADYGSPIAAVTPPNFTGTQFIKVMSNLNINNIDPNTLAFSRLLAVIPVTSSEADGPVYLAGGIQAPQYQTIGDPELKVIELELRSDNDKPLKVHKHWYVELSVLFEEEESTDVYRGLQAMTGPDATTTFYDGRGYGRLNSENKLKRRLQDMRDLETAERSDNRTRFNRF